MLDKNSSEYEHLTNDVRPHRENHWLSVYHQLSIPACLPDVQSVLEFGPGRGLMGTILKSYGLKYFCSDVVDYGANPDYPYAIKDFPEDQKFDLVCAFQTLEHNPPEDFQVHLQKMCDISSKYVYISLPYYGRWFSANFGLNLPKINRNFVKIFSCERWLKKERPIDKYRTSQTPYAHHWFEVGDKGFSKTDIKEYGAKCGLNQIRSFHSSSLPYHYFILFEKT